MKYVYQSRKKVVRNSLYIVMYYKLKNWVMDLTARTKNKLAFMDYVLSLRTKEIWQATEYKQQER